ncbi:hypothetical protein G7Z17_g12505 [Cylindrodendrum hubeiense]|uniref:Uncharacterized protein n=1 Tax=Cylindrodendrum hubeiense TaxID=595255 RepID=A0A9P5H0S3_9HYPO|nr:hypothetical protein G7Z17_g12505 [Cylindrodendrum hubeiense]
MRFSISLVAITAATANALAPAPTLTIGLTNLTAITQSLFAPAGKISSSNLGFLLKGLGPATTVITGLTNIVQLSGNLLGTPSSSSADSNAGVSTDPLLAGVVQISQSTIELLNSLSSKSDVFSKVPLATVPIHGLIASTQTALTALLDAILTSLTSGSAATDGTLANATPSLAKVQSSLGDLDTAFKNALAATKFPAA